MNIISFIAEKYNYASYIYPIRCDAKNRQNSLFVRFLILFAPFLGPGAFFTQTHIFDKQDEDIDIRFSSRERLISFISRQKFKNHRCNNEMLSLAIQGKDIPDEELFIVEARKNIFNKYTISVHKSYIQTIYNGEIIQLKIERYKDSIFNSNKFFVFVFSYKDNDIVLRANKKEMDIPFIDIMENISGISIQPHRTPLGDMWIS